VVLGDQRIVSLGALVGVPGDECFAATAAVDDIRPAAAEGE